MGLIGSILIAFAGAVVLIARGHVASSLARLLFATGIPAVAMFGLVLMLAAAVVFARRYRDATQLARGVVMVQSRRRRARSGSAVGEAGA